MTIHFVEAFTITHLWWKFYCLWGDYQIDHGAGLPIYELLGYDFDDIDEDI